MSKLIIFDLDGTLYRTESSYYPAVKNFLDYYHRPIPDQAFLDSLVGEPSAVFEAWITSMKIEGDPLVVLDDFTRFEVEEIARSGQLYEDVADVIATLHSRGYCLGICSNGPIDYVSAALEKFELTKLLSFVRVPGSERKTKTVMIGEIISEFPGYENYLVGDRFHDLQGARDNGLSFIGANYGFGGGELKTADFLLEKPTDLLEIL